MLGPIRVFRDGVPIEIGGTRAETLLALLALAAGSPVSADALIDELWAGEPPDGASTTLRSYVSRLRAALGDTRLIERVPAGYLLDVASESVDVGRFERRIREGEALLEQRRHRRAAEVLRAALELWRGRPFAGLAEEGMFRTEAARLEELRLHALEARVDADLELGRGGELVDELQALLDEHPFRERLWRHLMLALYRAGRQADALAAYHRARKALDEQLGLEPGPELQELETAILRQEVPSAAGAARPDATGLPVSLTTFVGRRAELATVTSLLRRSRLVTVVGVGGVGKTRLALEVARAALVDMVDGVAFVDLSTLSDPAVITAQIAAAIGVREQPGQSLAEGVASRIRGGDFLIVLDNCEHLRSAAAEVAETLLAAAPNLRILATSREVLGVPGEAAYAVPPLGLPDRTNALDELQASDAVRLLVDRATLRRHDLRLDDAAYETAARICQDLDGLPLAIELAAARTHVLSLEEIADRLHDRFQFLVSHQRPGPARHRTLREAMDWSYELLAPGEQRLLASLSVFPAGATLASIAAVCLDNDEDESERLIERLVDASLVVPIDGVQGTRYRLLETVRQYAAERVPDADLDDLRRRHAERARVIAESTRLGLETVGGGTDYDLAREELPSIRAAIQWAEHSDLSLAIEIACALERFWVTNLPRESLAMFNSLLGHEVIPAALRARALRCRGGLRYSTADFERGVADYEAALAIHRRLGDRAHIAHLLMRLAIEAYRAEDRVAARALLDEAALTGGHARFGPDQYVGLRLEADLAFDDGRHDEGLQLLGRTVELATLARDEMWQIDGLVRMAERALDLGRLDAAGASAREALLLSRAIEDRQSAVWSLAVLARHAADAGLGDRAGRIWGGLEAEVERGGPVGQWELEQDEIRAKVAGPAGAAFDPGVQAGRSLSLDEVVAEAVSLV